MQVAIPAVLPFIYQDISLTGADATLVLRLTTITTNAWFDALAPYTRRAVGVYSNVRRRQASESDNTNMHIALIMAKANRVPCRGHDVDIRVRGDPGFVERRDQTRPPQFSAARALQTGQCH